MLNALSPAEKVIVSTASGSFHVPFLYENSSKICTCKEFPRSLEEGTLFGSSESHVKTVPKRCRQGFKLRSPITRIGCKRFIVPETLLKLYKRLTKGVKIHQSVAKICRHSFASVPCPFSSLRFCCQLLKTKMVVDNWMSGGSPHCLAWRSSRLQGFFMKAAQHQVKRVWESKIPDLPGKSKTALHWFLNPSGYQRLE